MNGLSVLALTSGEQTMWLIALGIGAVVVAVVIALLTLLLMLVKHIDRGVLDVWETATRLAANTATQWQIRKTSETLQRIQREAQRHEQLLG